MADEQSAAKTSAKVQEVAANVQQASTRRRRISGSKTESVARRYFDAIAARDLEAAVGLWVEGGRENVRGQVEVSAPEGVREFIGGLLDAVPQLKFEGLPMTPQEEACGGLQRHPG